MNSIIIVPNALLALFIGILFQIGVTASQAPPTGANMTTTTTTSLPFSLLHQRCGVDVADAKECYKEGNLVCNDYERTQSSVCVCNPGTHPHPRGSLTCVPPMKIIPLGDPCNQNATLEQEQCSSDLAYCGRNGTCICGDDGWSQVQYDTIHNDCYLKSKPRPHNLPNRSHVKQAGGHDITFILAVISTALFISNIEI